MQLIIIIITLALIASAVILVLTYNGYLKDTDKDGIPDKVENKVKEVKKKIFKKKKWKNLKLANVETQQILMDIVTVLI